MSLNRILLLTALGGAYIALVMLGHSWADEQGANVSSLFVLVDLALLTPLYLVVHMSLRGPRRRR